MNSSPKSGVRPLAEGLERSRPTGDGLARLCRLLCALSRRAQPSEASRWWASSPS